ncbi:MAG TPA: cyanase [Acidimicrobiia bacterium]|nr:cyanase [Acidimicrobiia bacterium]
MERTECTQRILEAKSAKGLTFAEIGGKIGRSEVWTAAAIFGQAQMDASEAGGLCDLLDLEPEVALALQTHPMRGSLNTTVPVDPLIYRFHEITQVYGTTIKAIVNEKFGEGIMSAIDFELTIDKKEDPKGDRVVVTMNGKFLPFRKW